MGASAKGPKPAVSATLYEYSGGSRGAMGVVAPPLCQVIFRSCNDDRSIMISYSLKAHLVIIYITS